MPNKSEAEKKSDVASAKAEPRKPDPMVPPVTPAVVAQKVNEGTRFWMWVPMPICIDYNKVLEVNKMGRVAAEKFIGDSIEKRISKPRKQKGKDSWILKLDYPVDSCDVVVKTCEAAVRQIRSAMGE